MVVKILKNSQGIAVVEILPLLVVFIALIGLTLGLWGAIHAGILQSIAARNYAFEVINTRVHFLHHRDFDGDTTGRMLENPNAFNEPKQYYSPEADGMRAFSIVVYQEGAPKAFVAFRGLNFFKEGALQANSIAEAGTFRPLRAQDSPFHTSLFSVDRVEIGRRRLGVNPIWLMQGYGICLNSTCGDL